MLDGRSFVWRMHAYHACSAACIHDMFFTYLWGVWSELDQSCLNSLATHLKSMFGHQTICLMLFKWQTFPVCQGAYDAPSTVLMLCKGYCKMKLAKFFYRQDVCTLYLQNVSSTTPPPFLLFSFIFDFHSLTLPKCTKGRCTIKKIN